MKIPGLKNRLKEDHHDWPPTLGQATRLAKSAALEHGPLLQIILDNSTALVCVKDIFGRHLLVNRCCATLYRASTGRRLPARLTTIYCRLPLRTDYGSTMSKY